MSMETSAPEVTQEATGSEGFEGAGDQQDLQAQPQKYKLKVNGREVEHTIDDLIKNAQKGFAADEKFQQAAAMAKKYGQYEQFEKEIENGNLGTLINKIGPDRFRQFAENYLIDYLEYQSLSPEKKEALEYRQRYEQIKAQQEAMQAEQAERAKSAYRTQALEEIDTEISEVLKTFNRKPTPYLVARIAEQMLASLQSRDVDPKTVAKSAFQRAVKSLDSDVSEYLANMSVEDARRVLPGNLLDALRKSDVELVRSQDPLRSRQTAKTADKKPSGQKVRMSTDEFFKQKIEKMLG